MRLPLTPQATSPTRSKRFVVRTDVPPKVRALKAKCETRDRTWHPCWGPASGSTGPQGLAFLKKPTVWNAFPIIPVEYLPFGLEAHPCFQCTGPDGYCQSCRNVTTLFGHVSLAQMRIGLVRAWGETIKHSHFLKASGKLVLCIVCLLV